MRTKNIGDGSRVLGQCNLFCVDVAVDAIDFWY